MDVNYCFSLHHGDLHYAKITKKQVLFQGSS